MEAVITLLILLFILGAPFILLLVFALKVWRILGYVERLLIDELWKRQGDSR